jgi:RNA polymerase sigma-70 factor (ECF subfamily)
MCNCNDGNSTGHVPCNEKAGAACFALLFHQGHEPGLDHFFHLYYPGLCFFASRLTGDTEAGKDIASNAFLKTWGKREKLHTAGEIKAYLYQVVRNDCYKCLQQEKREQVLTAELETQTISPERSHLHQLIEAEVMAELHGTLQQMPAAQKKVFSKLFIEGKTVAETALELRLSVSTVKTQKARGLVFLRGRLTP